MLKLSWNHVRNALKMRWNFVRNAPKRCWSYVRNEIKMHWNNVRNALKVRWNFKVSVPSRNFSANQRIQRMSYIISAHSAHFLQKDALKRHWHLDPGINYLEHQMQSDFFWLRSNTLSSFYACSVFDIGALPMCYRRSVGLNSIFCSDPSWGGRNNILNRFFCLDNFDCRYIHCRELWVISLKSPSSREYDIKFFLNSVDFVVFLWVFVV